MAALNAQGLTITGPIAPGHVPARACLPHEVEGTYRRCILAVKAHHTADAVAALAPHVAEDGFVVSAQNGLNEFVIAAAVGRARTVGCFVNFGADYLEPGIVLYGGRAAVVVGDLDGVMGPRLAELHRLCLQSEDDAIATPNTFGFLWAKLIYGAQLFATALTDERVRPLLTRLAHEVVAVSRAEGIRLEAFDGFDPAAFLPEADPAATARSFDDMAAHNRRSAKSHSGIWRDLAVRKRRTEVDAQLGLMVEAGLRHGVPTPVTTQIIRQIHDIEEGRPLARANLDELIAGGGALKVDLSGRTAVVTGEAHGFGQAIAVALAGVGATVLACGIRDDELPATAAKAARSARRAASTSPTRPRSRRWRRRSRRRAGPSGSPSSPDQPSIVMPLYLPDRAFVK